MKELEFEKNLSSPEKLREMFENCPINFTINKIGGKWKPVIIHRIKVGVNRFGMLQRAIPIISKQMLTSQLRELENDGIIVRKIFAEIPPRVEYYISEKGESVFPVLESLAIWGMNNRE